MERIRYKYAYLKESHRYVICTQFTFLSPFHIYSEEITEALMPSVSALRASLYAPDSGPRDGAMGRTMATHIHLHGLKKNARMDYN